MEMTQPTSVYKPTPAVRWLATIFFLLVSLVLISLPIIQVMVPFLAENPNDPAYTDYVLLRYLGLTLYSLLFLQLMSGAFRRPLNKFLHPLVHHRWHVCVGFLVMVVAVAHPAFLYLSNKLLYGTYLFFGNGPRFNLGIVLGEFQLTLIFCGFLAAFLMNFFKRWMSFWRKIHWLMYLAFFSATVHSYILGSDINTGWYGVVRWGMVVLVSLAVVWRIYEYNILRKGRT